MQSTWQDFVSNLAMQWKREIVLFCDIILLLIIQWYSYVITNAIITCFTSMVVLLSQVEVTNITQCRSVVPQLREHLSVVDQWAHVLFLLFDLPLILLPPKEQRKVRTLSRYWCVWGLKSIKVVVCGDGACGMLFTTFYNIRSLMLIM
jgi:hypothetical protein